MEDLSNENIIHVKENGIEYLQFKKLLQYNDRLVHCYTLKPIDLKQKTKDDENYKLICNALGLNFDNVIMPNQTHTKNVAVAYMNSKSSDFPNVDGLITNEKNKVLSAVFADCTSLFFYDPVNNAIGNIHSGWRGTVQKIGKVTVEKMMKEYGTNPSDLICCIGPTIRQCHFEIEDDVMEIFMKSFNDKTIIKKGALIDGKQKYFADSVKANINMLKQCGLKEENIIDSGICTVCNNKFLHSYRCEKNLSGRNGAIMSLI